MTLNEAAQAASAEYGDSRGAREFFSHPMLAHEWQPKSGFIAGRNTSNVDTLREADLWISFLYLLIARFDGKVHSTATSQRRESWRRDMSRLDDRSTIAEWISEWFEHRGKSLKVTEILQSDADYIDTGTIDSIAMIEFIMDIESQFGVRLTSQTMKDPRFSKLRGLVEILEEMTNRKA